MQVIMKISQDHSNQIFNSVLTEWNKLILQNEVPKKKKKKNEVVGNANRTANFRRTDY